MSERQPAPGTWAHVMGVRIVEASATRVVAETTIAPCHLQAFGLVHGGVYSGLIETVASLGAWLARGEPKGVVGIENTTSFLAPSKEGVLRAEATPIHVGRTTQLWEGRVSCVRDGVDKLVASGRVRMMAT